MLIIIIIIIIFFLGSEAKNAKDKKYDQAARSENTFPSCLFFLFAERISGIKAFYSTPWVRRS